MKLLFYNVRMSDPGEETVSLTRKATISNKSKYKVCLEYLDPLVGSGADQS
jgi:hypothetical protein